MTTSKQETCQTPGCNEPHHAKGDCSRCYNRRRNATPARKEARKEPRARRRAGDPARGIPGTTDFTTAQRKRITRELMELQTNPATGKACCPLCDQPLVLAPDPNHHLPGMGKRTPIEIDHIKDQKDNKGATYQAHNGGNNLQLVHADCHRKKPKDAPTRHTMAAAWNGARPT